ncbi:UNVERIFIED_CONTAM: hypothetical protein Slati_2451800 [Sesamum latifolium]|uniref:Uncharacterized protein n=1 Tax=Sesamum latifolium TaxID=2727402 RepID=A0AAW2WDF7_9LAMI
MGGAGRIETKVGGQGWSFEVIGAYGQSADDEYDLAGPECSQGASNPQAYPSGGGNIESDGDSRVLEHGAAAHNSNMHAPMENLTCMRQALWSLQPLWRRRFRWRSWRQCQSWVVLHRPLIIRRSLRRLDHLGFLAILRLVRLFRRPVGLVLHWTFSVEVIPIRVVRCRRLHGWWQSNWNFCGVCFVACNGAFNAAGQYLCRDIHYFISENAAICPARSTERRVCCTSHD